MPIYYTLLGEKALDPRDKVLNLLSLSFSGGITKEQKDIFVLFQAMISAKEKWLKMKELENDRIWSGDNGKPLWQETFGKKCIGLKDLGSVLGSVGR